MSVLLQCRNVGNSIGRNINLNALRHSNSHKSIRRTLSKVSEESNFAPFLDLIDARRAQARRSIVVQVQSALSFKELHSYCSTIGVVKEMLHYVVGVEPMNFILVEFLSDLDVKNILEQSTYVDEGQVVPVQSQFLWFRASNRKLPKLKQSTKSSLLVENGTAFLKESEIFNLLKKSHSISDQMNQLYFSTRLNDLGTRLRFLTACQIENTLKGMFPSAKAFPFGSSVNSFGKMGCDLDLVLRLSDEKPKNDPRLMFHCKGSVGFEKKRNLEVISDLLQLFLPGCSQVRRILQARVPIVKYHQQLTDVECDLSMSNMSGVYMSDFLFIMGSVDSRVKPLVFTVRKWASAVGLTNSSPGRWITNFSLTLLVMAFLQKPLNSTPILPSLNTLVKMAQSNDHYVTEDGIDCTFLRDISKLRHFGADNKDSLESLLLQFFEFYAQFDFLSKAVCLNEPVTITKPEHCAMYIVNPLERGLNVSKNVGIEEMERFKTECRNAAWLLESQETKSDVWGLLSVFDNKKKASGTSFSIGSSSRQGRLMNVTSLFEEKSDKNIDFKNENVKKQVESIKNETQSLLKELGKSSR